MQFPLSPLAMAAFASCAVGPNALESANDLDLESRPAAERPFLWQVEGEKGASHLLGTIHLGVEAEQELRPTLWRLIDEAEVVVVEVTPQELRSAPRTPSSYLPPGETLDRLIGPAAWLHLQQAVGAQAAERLRQRTPWFAYSVVMQGLLPTTRPMDEAIAGHAEKGGQQLHALESVGFQMKTMAETIGTDDLRALLAPGGDERRRLRELVNAYRRGDVAAVTRMTANDRQDEEYARVMFDERNRAWVDTLEPLLRRGGAFVAVGVGHLLGEGSVVAMLKERGFKVQAVAQASL